MKLLCIETPPNDIAGPLPQVGTVYTLDAAKLAPNRQHYVSLLELPSIPGHCGRRWWKKKRFIPLEPPKGHEVTQKDADDLYKLKRKDPIHY